VLEAFALAVGFLLVMWAGVLLVATARVLLRRLRHPKPPRGAMR